MIAFVGEMVVGAVAEAGVGSAAAGERPSGIVSMVAVVASGEVRCEWLGPGVILRCGHGVKLSKAWTFGGEVRRSGNDFRVARTCLCAARSNVTAIMTSFLFLL